MIVLDFCSVRFERIGCFNDKKDSPRLLPSYMLNDRDEHLQSFSGQLIDWENWYEHLPDFVCRCAKRALEKGWRLFGIQFWGENDIFTAVWSSISAKTRSLYSVLDLLYFMLPYTMRHPTVLTLWLNFSIVHGTFCFSHSISRNWHTKLTIFCFFGKNGQLRNFRLSMLCFQHPSSCIRLRSTSFRNPSREGIAGAANLHP